MMNQEQAKSAVRSIIIGGGCLIAGYSAARGLDSSGTITGILTSETFISTATSLTMLIWGVWAKTKPNLLVTAASLVDDKGKKLVTDMNLTDRKIAAEVNSQVAATVTATPKYPNPPI